MLAREGSMTASGAPRYSKMTVDSSSEAVLEEEAETVGGGGTETVTVFGALKLRVSVEVCVMGAVPVRNVNVRVNVRVRGVVTEPDTSGDGGGGSVKLGAMVAERVADSVNVKVGVKTTSVGVGGGSRVAVMDADGELETVAEIVWVKLVVTLLERERVSDCVGVGVNSAVVDSDRKMVMNTTLSVCSELKETVAGSVRETVGVAGRAYVDEADRTRVEESVCVRLRKRVAVMGCVVVFVSGNEAV